MAVYGDLKNDKMQISDFILMAYQKITINSSQEGHVFQNPKHSVICWHNIPKGHLQEFAGSDAEINM